MGRTVVNKTWGKKEKKKQKQKLGLNKKDVEEREVEKKGLDMNRRNKRDGKCQHGLQRNSQQKGRSFTCCVWRRFSQKIMEWKRREPYETMS